MLKWNLKQGVYQESTSICQGEGEGSKMEQSAKLNFKSKLEKPETPHQGDLEQILSIRAVPFQTQMGAFINLPHSFTRYWMVWEQCDDKLFSAEADLKETGSSRHSADHIPGSWTASPSLK